MNIFTKALDFINFNNEVMNWFKFNGQLVYETFKKLLVSGMPPLALPKCKGVDLIDYKIYGSSEQIGDKTSNLIDFKQFKPYGSGKITFLENGLEYTGSYYISMDGSYLIPGKTYYMSWDYQTEEAIVPVVRYQYTDNTYSAGISNRQMFTIPSDKTVKNILLYPQISGTIHTTKFTNIMLSEGELKEYEPYGYKIPVTVSGKNLYDAEGHFNAIYKSETMVGYEPIKGVVDGVECYQYYGRNFSKQTQEISKVPNNFKENTQYTISFDAYDIFYTNPSNGTVLNGVNISFVYTDGTIKSLSNFNGTSKQEKIWKHWSVSSEVNKTLDHIQWLYSTGAAQTFFANMQIEEGTIETEYEHYVEPITTNIYLDEPLGENEVISFSKDNLPPIPTFKGTTIIEVDTTIQPSNMEVQYYGKEVK